MADGIPGYMREFTPELTEEFYKRLAKPIQEQTAQNVGLARSEALSRGLEGDPFEAIGVGAARTGGARSLGELYAGLGMQGAGMAREERLGETERGWKAGETEKQRGWESQEAEKLRAFQEKMAQETYNRQRDYEALMNRRKYQSELWSGLGQLAGSGLKSFASHIF